MSDDEDSGFVLDSGDDPSQLSESELIRRHTFPVVRRGYEPEQVREYLASVAARVQSLRERVLELEDRAFAGVPGAVEPEPDGRAEERGAERHAGLSDEIARVLGTLEDEVAHIRREADEQAERRVAEAERLADDRLREAQRLADERLREAERIADERVAQADEDLRSATSAAQRMRDQRERLRQGLAADIRAVREGTLRVGEKTEQLLAVLQADEATVGAGEEFIVVPEAASPDRAGATLRDPDD